MSLEHLQPPASGSDAAANADNKPAAIDAAIFAGDTRRADTPAGEGKITPGYGFADPIVGALMRQTIAMLAS